MDESEINKLINSMTKKFQIGGSLPKAKFENGGIIDCLRNGGSFQKCKCGDKVAKVAKGAEGVRITQQQDIYPEMTVKRNDGVDGTFKREYDQYNNRVETLTQRRPDGLVMTTTRTITPDQIDTSYTSGPINGMDFQQYVTPTKYKGMNFLQKMFNKVVPENWDAKFDRYKNGGELKKCGGPLPKKSKFKK